MLKNISNLNELVQIVGEERNLKRFVMLTKQVVFFCQHAANTGFQMNAYGTTKSQRKLGGVVINNMVVSVSELPDGTPESAICDVSIELEKLRRAVHA